MLCVRGKGSYVADVGQAGVDMLQMEGRYVTDVGQG